MARQQPPVPPANRSPKGTGSDPASADRQKTKPDAKQDGEQQNIAQNTHNQGYQQDR